MCRRHAYQVHLHVIYSFDIHKFDGIRFLCHSIFQRKCSILHLWLPMPYASNFCAWLWLSLTRPPHEASKIHQPNWHPYQFHRLISFGMLYEHRNTYKFNDSYGTPNYVDTYYNELKDMNAHNHILLFCFVVASDRAGYFYLKSKTIYQIRKFAIFQSFELCRAKICTLIRWKGDFSAKSQPKSIVFVCEIVCQQKCTRNLSDAGIYAKWKTKKKQKTKLCQPNVTETSDVSPHA